jgi:diamine N-acetyltransferase
MKGKVSQKHKEPHAPSATPFPEKIEKTTTPRKFCLKHSMFTNSFLSCPYNLTKPKIVSHNLKKQYRKMYEIRKISVKDIDALKEIGKQTFAETFSSVNSEENMTGYLTSEFSTEKLITQLTDEGSEFYFAELDGRPVGYLKINLGQSQTEIKDKEALEIERVYVLKEFHGKKVGQKLYEKALTIARQKSIDYVWLGVWEKNFRAIRFYEKNGFIAFDNHIFRLGGSEQTDIMMKLKIEYR